MIKTITLSSLRIDAIKTQFSYALKILGKMKLERITLFLREIEAKNISEISFHGLKPNTNDSDEDIFIAVDWDKHSDLIQQGKTHIAIDDTFEDGVAAETLIECYLFKENCEKKGLDIVMRVRCPSRINNNPAASNRIDKILGLRNVLPNEKINYSQGRSYKSTVTVNSIQEMSIKRSSN